MEEKINAMSAAEALREWSRLGMMKDDIETAAEQSPYSKRLDQLFEESGIKTKDGKMLPCKTKEMPTKDFLALLEWDGLQKYIKR